MECKCPICKKVFKVSSKEPFKDAKFFPFCSERCRLLDLGQWLDSEYKVILQLPPEDMESLSETPPNITGSKQ
jgi:endogenous inhibitor of DNA gyrase (YacG/DUF329 family)